jgi:hypothetical protein
MSLGPYVHCDCFERGRLRSPPPPSCREPVREDESLDCGSEDFGVGRALWCWCHSEACANPRWFLVEQFRVPCFKDAALCIGS